MQLEAPRDSTVVFFQDLPYGSQSLFNPACEDLAWRSSSSLSTGRGKQLNRFGKTLQ